MSDFGALTDHFGLTDAAAIFETVGELVDSSKVPVAQSRADALDENGDIAAASWYGNTAVALYEASCTYAIKSGSFASADMNLGELDTGIVALSIEIVTSNGAWPQVTVSGILGCSALEQSKTFALPTHTVYGKKQAQLLGVALTTGSLTDCTLSASCDFARQDDGEGEPVAYGVSGAVITATASAVADADDPPVLAAGAGYTLSQTTSLEEPQAAWHTAAITTEQLLTVTIA